MSENEQEQPKIIVDDDWKSQAQAEKEKLAAEQATQQAAPGADEAAEAEGRRLPPADFLGHIGMIASQALFALGSVPDPHTKQRHLDMELAKYHIDILKLLEDKTAGNLTEKEKNLLDTTLYELRTQYIQVAQAGVDR